MSVTVEPIGFAETERPSLAFASYAMELVKLLSTEKLKNGLMNGAIEAVPVSLPRSVQETASTLALSTIVIMMTLVGMKTKLSLSVHTDMEGELYSKILF